MVNECLSSPVAPEQVGPESQILGGQRAFLCGACQLSHVSVGFLQVLHSLKACLFGQIGDVKLPPCESMSVNGACRSCDGLVTVQGVYPFTNL